MSLGDLFRRRRFDANNVVPGLWVGSAPDARSAAQLVDQAGIDAVLDLRAERPEGTTPWPDSVEVRYSSLTDHGTPTAGELAAAAQEVVDLMRRGREVLVHCHAGLERGPTVACAALVLTGWRLSDAYATVSSARPAALPTEGQMAVLTQFAEDRARGAG